MLRYINYVGFQTMKNFYKKKPDKMPQEWNEETNVLIARKLLKITKLLTTKKPVEESHPAVAAIEFKLTTLASTTKNGTFGIDFVWDRELRDVLIMFSMEATCQAAQASAN